MKQLSLLLLVTILAFGCYGQSKGVNPFTPAKSSKMVIIKDANGDLKQVPGRPTSDSFTVMPYTFTDAKGEVFTVYKSRNDKLYIIRTSKKTGNNYKQYLKI
jgi:hypothetical protein